LGKILFKLDETPKKCQTVKKNPNNLLNIIIASNMADCYIPFSIMVVVPKDIIQVLVCP
jgi:hypothetical protein